MEESELNKRTKGEIEAAIAHMRLSRTDRRIAQMRLVDCALYADIGAEVGYDRRTVARHVHRILDRMDKAA